MQRKSRKSAFEERYRELLDLISEPIMVLNREGILLAANDALWKLAAVRSEAVIGKHFSELGILKESDVKLVERKLEDRLSGRIVEDYELNLHIKGETKWVEPKGNRVKYLGEDFDLVVLHDITQRKCSQRQLLGKIAQIKEQSRLTENKFRKLFLESMEAIFIGDDKGKIVDCNPATCMLLGKSRSELIGQNYSALHTELHVNEALNSNWSPAKDLPMHPIETRILTAAGEKFVSFRLSVFEFKGKKYLQGTIRDVTERKLMQQTLFESEEKFRAIANSVKDAIILVDEEAKVTYWNPAAEKTFGYLSCEVVGKCVHDLVLPKTIGREEKERIDKEVKSFSESGIGYFTVGNVSLTARRKDDSVFPAELSLSPIKLRGKWVAVGVIKDVTERKKYEEKMREAEERYHALFNYSPLGVLVVDPETMSLIEYNDVAHLQLGYSREEFTQVSIFDIEVNESPEEIKAHVAEMIKTGGCEFETRHRTKNGEIRNVLVTTRTILLKGKIAIHCIFHDITEIRKVQNALMESEARYRLLVELAQVGIWAVNNECKTVFVNPRMIEMLGYSESEMIGRSLFDFLERDDEKIVNVMKSASSGIVKTQFEYTFPRKDGGQIITSVSISTMTNDNGQPVGALVLVTDITEIKKLQSKLSQYSQKLEELVEKRTEQLKLTQAKLVKSERLAAIGELAGMIGHDLRNPLTGIKNSAYFLRKKGNTISPAQAKEMLDIIDKCVDYSNKIVSDLLDYSRVINLELQECSPRKLLLEALAMINIPDTIQFSNKLPDEPTLNVDLEKTKRVFLNLVKNAVEAMHDAGKITVEGKQVGAFFEISVADTGPGISDQILPNLFMPLFTTKAQGMGFGLAICKRIVEAHGGSIKVNTKTGVGTTFTITLPMKLKSNVGGEQIWIDMSESSLLTTMKP